MATVSMTGDLATTPQRRVTRVFAASVGTSLGFHAALLMTLPDWMRAGVRVVPLEVTLQEVAPPRASPMPPPAEKRAKAKERAGTPMPERPRPTPPHSLALSRQATAPEPASTLPAPEPRVASEPQPSAPREPAGAAPRAEGVPTDKITPPVFTAAYLRNPEPVYPVSSRRRGEQGTVLLKVVVTREGAAANVNVEKTSGHSALDEAALAAVRKWRFAPARRGAEAVESTVVVPIVFELKGAS